MKDELPLIEPYDIIIDNYIVSLLYFLYSWMLWGKMQKELVFISFFAFFQYIFFFNVASN